MSGILWVWINGRWLSPDEAQIPFNDRSFLLGDGCFETMRFANGEIEGFVSHLELLRKSAALLGIEGGPNDEEVWRAIQEQAKVLQRLSGEAAVRITLSRGAGGRGAETDACEPIMVISATPLETARPYAPLRVITSSVRRNETSPLSRIKSTSYGDNLEARKEVQAAGAEEALMLNTQGRVACLSMGSIIILDHGDGQSPKRLITPSQTEGARAGYMRQLILEAARTSGWEIEEGQVLPHQLIEGNVALFGANSLWGMRPIASVDGWSFRLAPPIA